MNHSSSSQMIAWSYVDQSSDSLNVSFWRNTIYSTVSHLQDIQLVIHKDSFNFLYRPESYICLMNIREPMWLHYNISRWRYHLLAAFVHYKIEFVIWWKEVEINSLVKRMSLNTSGRSGHHYITIVLIIFYHYVLSGFWTAISNPRLILDPPLFQTTKPPPPSSYKFITVPGML